MIKRATSLLKGRGGYNFSVTFFPPAVFILLMMLTPAAFCAAWEPIGPEGGNFIFSITNPADANEVTAMMTSPSPSNVYRSTDAGASWSKIGQIPDYYINDVSAFDFSTLYAVSSSSSYRSMDGGASWTTTPLPPSAGWAYNICVDPTDSSKVYASGYIYDYYNYPYTYRMVFFKSTDGGLSWSASSFFTFDYFYPYDMAISKSNPNVIYIVGNKEVQVDYYYSYYGALFKSTDGGESWTDISDSVVAGDGDYFYFVAVDPTDVDRVYVGGSYFYRGVRTGRGLDISWERSPTSVYAYAIDIDPVDPSRIYLAGYENVSVSTDYGRTWTTRYGSVQNSAQHVEIAPADPSRIYVSSYTGLFSSSDSGATWETSHEGIYAASISALAVASSRVVIQNSGYLMSCSNPDNVWRYVVTPESCGTVCDILLNSENPDKVLILEDYG
jgi:photosystem II stability/assembly factor-like uncharacterized protein